VESEGRPNPREWHGHRIVTEDDLVRDFDDHDPEHVDDPHHYSKRLRHGVVLVLLLALVVTAVVGAYMVATRQIVVPGWEPQGEPTVAAAPEPACPVDVLSYMDPKTVTVNVYNATQINGLAGAAANRLEKRGFRIGEVGNKVLNDPDVVAAVVSGTAGRAQALTVQRNIKGTEYVKDPKRTVDSVDLVVGQDFDKLIDAVDVVTKDGRLRCPRATAEEKKS
jgi:hypothetical protein